MKQDNKCPKCGGEFEEGLLPDKSYLSVFQQVWGTKIQTFFGGGRDLDNQRKVVTYRCRSCGYLESYAN